MTGKPHLLDVAVCDEKYRLIQRSDGGLEALRYGEKWRDLCRDGLVLALGSKIDELRDLLAEAHAAFACDNEAERNRVLDLLNAELCK